MPQPAGAAAGAGVYPERIQAREAAMDRLAGALGLRLQKLFLRRLPELDAAIAERLATAQRGAGVLRHVAKLDRARGARVGLVEIPPGHAFAHLHLTDNIVQFTTQRYRDNPLVVQGPGAGPEVTAAGVFADLLRVAAALGARL